MQNRAVLVIIGLLVALSVGMLLIMSAGSSHAQSPLRQATSTLSQPTATPANMETATQPTMEARPIELDSVVEEQLAVGMWDIWTFDGQAKQVVTITLNSIEFDAYLELYSPDADQIPFALDDDSGRATNAQLAELVLPLSGTYRIWARSVDDAGSGHYLLHLESGLGTGAVLENSQPIQYGANETGQLGEFESVYTFESRAGDSVTILLSSSDFDPFLTLTDATGNIIGENDDNGRNRNSALVGVEIPADGDYYVFVSPFEHVPNGTFVLELYETSEESETEGGTISIGETVAGHLAPNTFAEWQFGGEAGQVISAGAITVPFAERLDLSLQLYGPDGEIVEEDDNGGVILNPAITDIRLPADGAYRLRIFESAPTIGGDYQLTLTEGRAYFGPGALVAPLIVLADEGTGATPLRVLNETDEAIDVWLIAGVDEAPFTITLRTSGGEASLDDFVIRLFDTDWMLLADSTDGQLVLEELSPLSSEYLILVEHIGRGERDYQLILQSGDAPLIDPTSITAVPSYTPVPTMPPTPTEVSTSEPLTLDVRGEMMAGQPVVDVLSQGLSHRWEFTARVASLYTITLSNTGGVYDPFLIVEDIDGNELATDDDSAGNFNAQISLDLDAGETVVIIASSFAEQSGGRYELLVTGDETVPTPLPQTPTPTAEADEPPRI